MTTIKLTSKRQATFPKTLCDEMNLQPGDALIVVKRVVDGEAVWCLRPVRDQALGWFGALRSYGAGKPHDMASIRRSVERKRSGAG